MLRLLIAACLLWALPTFAQEPSLKIVATTTQAADLARILTEGVDDVEVVGLMGAGVDPHLYQPTEADIAAMNQADVVIYSGLHLEGQFDAVFAALAERGVSIYAVADPVQAAGYVVAAFNEAMAERGADDPHFWFDPRNWELSALGLAALLSDLDPTNSVGYTANAEAYVLQLQSLFTWAEEGMLSVPAGQRYIVTSHDAFQYFGAAFGWRMAAVQGISTVDEAGVGDIQAIVDFIVANDIPVLFVESSIAPDTIQAVAAAVADAGSSVRTGLRPLYSDAMGDPADFGGTYIGMIAENVYTILQSYQCAGVDVTIPAWPQALSPTPPATLLDVDCDATPE